MKTKVYVSIYDTAITDTPCNKTTTFTMLLPYTVLYLKTKTGSKSCGYLGCILQNFTPLRNLNWILMKPLTHFLWFLFALEVWRGHLFFQRSVGLLGLLGSWKEQNKKHDELTLGIWCHLLAKDSNCFILQPLESKGLGQRNDKNRRDENVEWGWNSGDVL